jgi:uncharacterized protein (TIRG00374 family)
MKKFLFFLISLILGVALFLWTVNFVGLEEIKSAFLVFAGWQGVVIFSLTFLMMMVGAWKWKEILKEEGVNVSFQDLFKTYLAGFSVMFLAPALFWVSELFRSYTLKKRKQVPWSKAMASVIIDRILEWTTILITILFGSIFFLSNIGLPSKELGIAFGLVFFFFAIGICLFYFKIFRKESIAKTFGKILNGEINQEPLETEKEIFNFFKLQKQGMWKGFALSFLKVAIACLRGWILIIFLGKEISYLSALSILSFTYLAAMIPIPTSLGSHEAIQSFAFNSLGLGIPTATAFTMIIRTAELLVALLGLFFLFRFGTLFLKSFVFPKIKKLTWRKDKL